MDNDSPLDAPSGFTPSDEDRPAGEWMEGYWKKTVPWALRFAYASWAYFAWIAFSRLVIIYSAIGRNDSLNALQHTVILIGYATVPIIGYYAYRFARDLNGSLVAQDQALLERAFRHLHRFLIVGLITGAIWILPTIIQWERVIHLMESIGRLNSQNPDIPIQSESNTDSLEE